VRPHKYVAPTKEAVTNKGRRRAPKNIVEFAVDFSDWRWDQHLHQRPKTEAQAVMEAAPYVEPEESVEERQQLAAVVRQAVSELDSNQQMLLDAIVFERRSFRYLERLWCIPKSTLFRWYAAALLELRVKLIEYPEIVEYLDGRTNAKDEGDE